MPGPGPNITKGPLDHLVDLFVVKYGASPQEALRQARYYMARPDDEMGASFIQEAVDRQAAIHAKYGPKQAPLSVAVGGDVGSASISDLVAADAANRQLEAQRADMVPGKALPPGKVRPGHWAAGFDPSTLEPTYAQKTGQRDGEAGRATTRRR